MDADAGRLDGEARTGGRQAWVIVGNSGSGKSTLARELAAEAGVAVLDLDTVAWRADSAEPVRRGVEEVAPELAAFVAAHPGGWVMEGCYEDLIAYAFKWRPELVWLDVPVEVCAARVRARAHEPHKYATPEAQAEATQALVNWIAAYATREGPMSRAAHAELFENYVGPKRVGGR